MSFNKEIFCLLTENGRAISRDAHESLGRQSAFSQLPSQLQRALSRQSIQVSKSLYPANSQEENLELSTSTSLFHQEVNSTLQTLFQLRLG